MRALATAVKTVGAFGSNTVNDKKEYAPPCSKGPGDKTYTLTLYALSASPKLDAQKTRVTRAVLLDAIKDKVLAATSMDVVYARPAGREDDDDRPPRPETRPTEKRRTKE